MKTHNYSNWMSILSKIVLTVTFHFCFFCLQAEECNVTITAGKLNSALKGKENVTKLTISGKMNGSDFLYIRGLYNLCELDMTNAIIVPGGKVYLENQGYSGKKKYKVTEADVLPEFVFLGRSNLRKIILPKQLVKVDRNALVTNNPNLVIQFTSQKPPRIEAQYVDNGTEDEVKNTSNTNDVNDILGSVSSNEMAKYFGIESSKKENPNQVCAKIIVPGNSYLAYKAELNEHIYKSLVKDYAPSEYTISLLLNTRLSNKLEGGYNFVKRLTLRGDLDIDNLKFISQLKNLRYLNLREAEIKDGKFTAWLYRATKRDVGELLNFINIYATPSTAIIMNDTICYYSILNKILFSVDTSILNLAEKRRVLLFSLQELQSQKNDLDEARKKAEKQAAQNALLYGLLGMSGEVLDKQYEHEEISTIDYMSNKMFGEALKEELEKEIQKADLSDPNVYARVSKEIDKGIATYKQQIKELEIQMKPTEESIKKQLNDFYNAISNGSIIPSYAFEDLWRLQKVILPENTVLIGDHAFLNCSESLVVEVNANAKQLGAMKD